jgi:hypothetical protein
MRKWTLALALILVTLCGCTRHYVITLDNGVRLGSNGKPKLKKGFYVYKDGLGREAFVSSARVSEVSPASMSSSSKFRPSKP